ncbi:Protein NRT1/ PTR FAMILY 2.8 [Capsicum chinense]|uniref:Protein NRT1/ PTR FAMILY 2.8 n=1 Tax=Capsicum annuum TaxID=4072 RepID=A0A2G3A1P0_CAPAN|nr:Protein NRT1/ PTR FAMILY 2.8 [Capsicum annuum]PHT88120.1 Protein NRT1/ PTR FAMILY 2.8 [Capsicum annuum]PHT98475.1 Protein NRT1/ PTR FAMILY 2.8 [Capsicum chinense]
MAEEIISESHSSREEEHVAPNVARFARKQGGWTAIAYILGNESFEKLASVSLISNMTTYLRTKYNMGGVFLVNVVSIWSGFTNITPLAGAYLADARLGRFLTLLFGSLAAFLGMGLVTLTAGIDKLRPPRCQGNIHCEEPQSWQLAYLYIGLGFMAIGSGGIRACNIAFGADQFDTNTEKGRAQLKSFFNWWYFSFTIALIIALGVVVYIQTNISWFIGFLIPTCCLAVSIVIFLIGRRTYIRLKPQGCVFIDMAKVINAACRKRHVLIVPTASSLYDHATKESENELSVLRHTDRFKCLDKAAIIVDRSSELNAEGVAKDNWRLCSVDQVERLKCVVGILPVWVAGITCFITMEQMSTFGVLQVIQSNTKVGNFNIPPGWMGIASMISLAIWIFIYECVYIPSASKISKKEARLSLQIRIKIGIVMAILCLSVAAFVETRRRDLARKEGTFISPLSVGYFLPQFILSGLTEAFAAVSVMEFLNNQVHETMRSVAGAIFFLSLSIASYLNTLIVNLVKLLSELHGRKAWLGGHDLNDNKLERFYLVIAGLGVLNFMYFHFFASHFIQTFEESKRRKTVLEERVDYVDLPEKKP